MNAPHKAPTAEIGAPVVYHHFIGGEYVDPAGGEWIDSTDPYRNAVWAKIPRGTKADVDAAVAAAKRAMTDGPWAGMTPTQRGKIMRRLGDLVAENAQRLAEIEVRDNGKLMSEMQAQLNYHPEWWYYYAGLADKIEGSVIPIDKPDHFAFTSHEPVGVVGALTAWNSPLMFIAWKCAPARAAGCSVVVKPSEFTSA
ncbi:MAG: aldehyde dehydrogenase family protein, partial [Pseudomonadota bacterium]